ncbi:uncharacterized protein LOC135847015 [Planococcus citri]|uniref:uncharacterized protein LOC135847015 n=1 Tax=Planococcus citri TaxID=170843 RepID=UPI0031F79B86
MNSRTIHESALKQDAFSDMSVFAARIPSLQKMASYQIAIQVWYNYIHCSKKKSFTAFHCDVRNTNSNEELIECSKLIKSLGMPRFVENELKKCLKKVRQETIDCQAYFRVASSPTHMELNFHCSPNDVRVFRPIRTYCTISQHYKLWNVNLNCFVWYPNGRIDYKSTAVKLSTLSNLTEAQKFVIISNHCLQNEIQSIDLHILVMLNFIDKLSFQDTPVQYYWFCYLNNDIRHNIPLDNFNSADVVMATKYYDEGLWEGFQYFWDRMRADEQVSFISNRLRPFDKSFNHRRLFFKMSHRQLINLLSKEPADTIKAFLVSLNLPRHAIWAWVLTKNDMPNEKFVKLVNDLLRDGNIHYDEKRMNVCLEMWDTMTDRHKNHVSQSWILAHLVTGILGIFQNTRKLVPSALKFLVKLVRLGDANFRKDVILKKTSQFALQLDFDIVGEMLDLCFPNHPDRMQFLEKNDLDFSPYHCEILYSEDDFKELNKRLLSCLQNLNLASNFVKELIESKIMFNRRVPANILYSSDCRTYWNRLRYFIEEIYQETPTSVFEMKRAYISSFAASSDPYERYGSLNELAELIELEFVHERLHSLRRSFSKVFKKTLPHLQCYDIFVFDSVKNIFTWCFENDARAFRHFKRKVPIEDIFNAIYRDVVRLTKRSHHPLVRKIDEFLLWYFSGVTADVIKFKSEMNDNSKVKERMKYAWLLATPHFELEQMEWMSPRPPSILSSDESAPDTRSPTSSVPPSNKKKEQRFGLKKIKQWFSKSTTNL